MWVFLGKNVLDDLEKFLAVRESCLVICAFDAKRIVGFDVA